MPKLLCFLFAVVLLLVLVVGSMAYNPPMVDEEDIKSVMHRAAGPGSSGWTDFAHEHVPRYVKPFDWRLPPWVRFSPWWTNDVKPIRISSNGEVQIVPIPRFGKRSRIRLVGLSRWTPPHRARVLVPNNVYGGDDEVWLAEP